MGGGDCDRSRFRFKNDTDIEMAEQEDYSKSDFDMGHLANSEDFAFDCKKDEMTFRFYNCLPQYPNLNRGAWKRWENTIRKDSRLDSLRIICGGHEYIREIGNNVYIPEYCWKVVISLSKKKAIYVLWFKNVNVNAKDFVEELTLEELEKRLGYKLPKK